MRFRGLLPAALFALALLSACGGKSGPSAPKGPDFSTPEAVWAVASKALEAGDLAALSVFLSDDGRAQVTRDLLAWKGLLSDPATGPRALARLPAAKTVEERNDLERALAGDVPSLLRLYVRADPHPAAPPAAPPVPPRAADVVRLEFEYAASDGTRRRVVVGKTGADWKIDRLQL